MQFRLDGRDQHGRPMAAGKPNWTANGGKIDGNGGYVAGDKEGSFVVEVACGEVKAIASVAIAKGVVPPPPPPPPLLGKAIQWSGSVPSAKWMTFYTKVLAKYAKEKGLTLRASFELRPEQGLSKEQIDELRATLRELGLDDDVQAS
jgi:hypothetical protein